MSPLCLQILAGTLTKPIFSYLITFTIWCLIVWCILLNQLWKLPSAVTTELDISWEQRKIELATSEDFPQSFDHLLPFDWGSIAIPMTALTTISTAESCLHLWLRKINYIFVVTKCINSLSKNVTTSWLY